MTCSVPDSIIDGMKQVQLRFHLDLRLGELDNILCSATPEVSKVQYVKSGIFPRRKLISYMQAFLSWYIDLDDITVKSSNACRDPLAGCGNKRRARAVAHRYTPLAILEVYA